MNLPSILLMIFIILAVAVAVLFMWKHRGESNCGGNCSACGRNCKNKK